MATGQQKMKNFKLMSQFFGADGSIHFMYRGMTPVASIWSDGLRRTRFVVSFFQDGTMDVKADGHSRQPYYRDVLEALSSLLGTTTTKRNLFRREPRIGTDWISCGRFDARVNEDQHLSLRDRQDSWHVEFAGTVPVGFMKEALPYLFELGNELEEGFEPEPEEVFSSEAERFERENNRVLFEGRPIASYLGH